MTDPKAHYRITATDDSAGAWRSAVSNADKGARQIKNVLAASFGGLAIGTLFVSQVSKAIEFGDEIGKLKTKLNTSAEATSELVAVAKQFDIEIGDLSVSLRKMQVSISEASSGNKSMIETFQALGLKIEDIRRLKPEDQFIEIAGAIASLRDPTDRARAATDLFGRSGAELLPLFSQGAAGIRQARDEVRQFGNVLSELEVKKLQEADDAIKKLSASWSRFWSGAAVLTVDAAEALDIIDKDKLGEFQDQLAAAKEELRQASDLPEGGPFDPKRYEDAAKAVQVLERQIKNLQSTYSRGGGSRRGRDSTTAPGFGTPSTESTFRKQLNPQIALELEENLKFLEQVADKAIDDFKAVEDLSDSVADSVSSNFRDVAESNSKALDDMHAKSKAATDEFTVFADEAARNMQDAFADFLFDPFADGIDGMLKGFVNIVRRMLAEAASAQLFKTLFGDGKDGSTGSLSGIFSAVIGAFGGHKAKGGPLESGKWYVAGEHGPEPIWGGGSGAFASGYGGGGGGGSVTINMPVDMRGATVDAVKLFAAEKPRLLRQAADLAKAELRQDKRRGRF
jgi:hypothetical protein